MNAPTSLLLLLLRLLGQQLGLPRWDGHLPTALRSCAVATAPRRR